MISSLAGNIQLPLPVNIKCPHKPFLAGKTKCFAQESSRIKYLFFKIKCSRQVEVFLSLLILDSSSFITKHIQWYFSEERKTGIDFF